MTAYLYVAVFALAAVLFAVVTLAISSFVSPKGPNEVKSQPYECGMEPLQPADGPFNVRYFLLAILFLVFDVEALFLFPWIIALRPGAIAVLLEMLGFTVVLGGGLAYAWRKGALDWR